MVDKGLNGLMSPAHTRKTDRKITFSQFEDAVRHLAEKKYPGDPSGVQKLTRKLTSGDGPSAHGTTVLAGLTP